MRRHAIANTNCIFFCFSSAPSLVTANDSCKCNTSCNLHHISSLSSKRDGMYHIATNNDYLIKLQNSVQRNFEPLISTAGIVCTCYGQKYCSHSPCIEHRIVHTGHSLHPLPLLYVKYSQYMTAY